MSVTNLDPKDGQTAIALLRAHEELDKARFENIDSRFDDLMKGVDRMQGSVENAHKAMHQSIVDLGKEMRDSVKSSNDTHLKIMTRITTGLAALVVGLILYIWYHRDQISG